MGPQRTYSLEAIILNRLDLGETDRILTLLTPNKGKLRVVAKGVRRPASKKAGHLELFCQSLLHMATGRNLDIITQAQSNETFLALRSNAQLWHMTCAFYIAELIDRFIEDDIPHFNVYELLLLTLRTLDADAALEKQAAEDTDDPFHTRTQLLLRYFEIHLLTYVGYEPGFKVCAHCGAELQPVENGFTPSMGGALCPNCSQLWNRALSLNALKVLRILQRTPWERLPQLRLDARVLSEIEMVMYGLVRYHLERDPQSWNALHQFHLPA